MFNYLFARLLHTFTNDGGAVLARFLQCQLTADDELEAISDRELDAILETLDTGSPVPLGLIHVSGLAAPWGNHQVLAIGRFTRAGGEPVIELYDPNFPDETIFLFPDRGLSAHDRAGTDPVVDGDGNTIPVRGFFSTLDAYATLAPPW